MNAEAEMARADGLGAEPTPTATIQAADLERGDLILCGVKFREVMHVETRSESLATGEPTELYVTVGDRDRLRRMTLTADLTLLIRDRAVLEG